ncbi:Long-chain-fatty-acid-CoA ligase [Mycena venus]|uniref:Long-chain-fatty-acid-CoA ligase n=1 Tax=Mycena venus TaxID=2733690 RepID=A0A8H7CN65_9AGAR|nr:Long-chain-fatty-acid-CoA ligase [Mycena venus]
MYVFPLLIFILQKTRVYFLTQRRRPPISANKLVTRPFKGIDTVYDVLEYVAKTHGMRDALSVNWQLIAHACGSISTRNRDCFLHFSSKATKSNAHSAFRTGLTYSLNEPSCTALFSNTSLLPTLLKVLNNTPTVKFVIYDGEGGKVLTEAKEARSDIQLSIEELRKRGKDVPESVLEGRTPTPETVMVITFTHANLIASRSSSKPFPMCTLDTSPHPGRRSLHARGAPPHPGERVTRPLAHILEYIVQLIILFVGMPTGFGGVKVRFRLFIHKLELASVGLASYALRASTFPFTFFPSILHRFTLIELLFCHALTDASVRNCDGDIKAFRPSIMVGVPAVWETIQNGIVGKVAGGGRAGERIPRGGGGEEVRTAFFIDSLFVHPPPFILFYLVLLPRPSAPSAPPLPLLPTLLERSLTLSLAGAAPSSASWPTSVILNSLRAVTGGRLRIAMSSGASVERGTQEFLSVALVMLLQGASLLLLLLSSLPRLPRALSPSRHRSSMSPPPSLLVVFPLTSPPSNLSSLPFVFPFIVDPYLPHSFPFSLLVAPFLVLPLPLSCSPFLFSSYSY